MTGTNTTARAGTLPFPAYNRRVTWTGQKLRQARARRSWTQKDLAEQLGASLRSVAAWERDEAHPQAHWLVRLDELLGDSDGQVAAPATAPASVPAAESDTSLKQATVMEILAELASRFAQAEARATKPSGDPGQPFERVHWRTSDAPSAARGSTAAPDRDVRDA